MHGVPLPTVSAINKPRRKCVSLDRLMNARAVLAASYSEA